MDEVRFRAAIEAFDRANAEDPSRIVVDGHERPRELVHAEWLSEWVRRLAPDADEALLLAARCQHLRRWTVPRASFPEGRVGYLQWRTQMARFHAAEAERILAGVGYDEAMIAAVRRLNLKQGLRSDPNTQLMEDALCLSFIEHELEEFAARHAEPKVLEVLQKTWRKMTERGHARALELPLALELRQLVERALAERA
jgi:hypothetical protein